MTPRRRPNDLSRRPAGRAPSRGRGAVRAAARFGLAAGLSLLLATGCSGGEAATTSDASKTLPAPSVRDLEQLNREFVELQRLSARMEAQLSTVGAELRSLEAMSREVVRQEATVQKLIATVSGKLPASPLAGPDPIQYARTYGPYALALLVFLIIIKIRDSRLRESDRYPGPERDEPEDRA